MSNEIVRYHSQLNNVALKNFNSNEIDILMVLMSKTKDKGTQEITLTFNEIKKLAHYKNQNPHKLAEDIRSTNKKLLGLNIMLPYADNPEDTIQFSLFHKFITKESDKTLTVKVSEEFKYILNDLKTYTSFEVEEITTLKSKYSKKVYRQLKQFKKTGWWSITIDEYRELLDIPDSYESRDITKLNKKISQELAPYFLDLTIETINDIYKSGNPIRAFKFIWTPSYNDTHPLEPSQDNTQSIDSKITGYLCRKCGRPLIEKVINGEIAYCHEDGWKASAECKMIYNSIAEVKGYEETPTRESQNQKQSRFSLRNLFKRF